MFKTNSLVAVTSLSRPKTEFYQSTMPYSTCPSHSQASIQDGEWNVQNVKKNGPEY